MTEPIKVDLTPDDVMTLSIARETADRDARECVGFTIHGSKLNTAASHNAQLLLETLDRILKQVKR